MSRFGFVGPSYTSQSLNADAQTCINWYPEIDESGAGNSPIVMYPTPGLQLFSDLSAPLAIIQKIGTSLGAGSPSDTLTITPDNDVLAGSAILLIINAPAGSAVSSIDDGDGDVFALLFTANDGTARTEVWMALNVAAGTAVPVVTFSGPEQSSAMFYELSGVLGATPLDQDSANNGSWTATSLSAGSITAGNAAQIVFSSIVAHVYPAVDAGGLISPGSGWTQDFRVTTGTTNVSTNAAQHRFISGTGVFSGSMSAASPPGATIPYLGVIFSINGN